MNCARNFTETEQAFDPGHGPGPHARLKFRASSAEQRNLQMAFSFFRRKDKTETPGDPQTGPDGVAIRRPPASASDSLAARRHAARSTEEKIDRIESEMIEAAKGRPTSGSELRAPLAGKRGMIDAPATLRVTDWFGANSDVLPAARSTAFAIDVNASALPGVLEEAAIEFARGEAATASATLRLALIDADLGDFLKLGWLMLLDLHQLTGARQLFESLALDYAARFDAYPPIWTEGEGSVAGEEQMAAGSIIAFPARIDDAIATRIDLVERGMAKRRETVIDFNAVETIDAAGASRLLTLLRRFENAPSRYALLVRHPQRLFGAARKAIEPGRRDESDACWRLALFALRLLDEAQRFEDLGIEYCVTYEVSPPSWEPLPRSIRLVGKALEPVDRGLGVATAIAPPAEPSAFVLAGEMIGRMHDRIKALRAFSGGRPDVVIDCRKLRRIDFVAVGELLNEIVTLRTAGKQVLVVEPNRLVFALMLVMGIHELAEIRERRI